MRLLDVTRQPSTAAHHDVGDVGESNLISISIWLKGRVYVLREGLSNSFANCLDRRRRRGRREMPQDEVRDRRQSGSTRPAANFHVPQSDLDHDLAKRLRVLKRSAFPQ